jgi:paired amphipathic helix protein Sin3a
MNDWTEGVSHEISWPFLRRNLPKDLETEEDYGKTYLPQWNQDGLTVKVCPNSYHLLWDEGTDWFFHDTRVSQRGLGGMAALKDERKDQFEEKFVKNAKWMAGMNLDEVTNINTNFNKWVKGPEAVSASAVNGDGDDVMTGT